MGCGYFAGFLTVVFWFCLRMLLLVANQHVNESCSSSSLAVSCFKKQGHLHVVVFSMLELSALQLVFFTLCQTLNGEEKPVFQPISVLMGIRN